MRHAVPDGESNQKSTAGWVGKGLRLVGLWKDGFTVGRFMERRFYGWTVYAGEFIAGRPAPTPVEDFQPNPAPYRAHRCGSLPCKRCFPTTDQRKPYPFLITYIPRR